MGSVRIGEERHGNETPHTYIVAKYDKLESWRKTQVWWWRYMAKKKLVSRRWIWWFFGLKELGRLESVKLVKCDINEERLVSPIRKKSLLTSDTNFPRLNTKVQMQPRHLRSVRSKLDWNYGEVLWATSAGIRYAMNRIYTWRCPGATHRWDG